MQWISAERIAEVLTYPALVDWLDQAHRENSATMDDLLLSYSTDAGSQNHFLLRAAWQEQMGVGAKLVTVFPLNRNVPSVQGVYLLFSAEDGRLLAALDGTALTGWKTAADSALATRRLARADVRELLMVGAGAMAPHLVRAHLAVRPGLERVSLWNRTRARAERLAQQLRAEGMNAEVVNDLTQAVVRADVICCATMATEPLIRGVWLRPGVHLDLVGAFTPEMREVDDSAVTRARIFVDCRRTAIVPIGELAIPLRNGLIAGSAVLADHFQLSRREHPGRTSAEEITLFKNGGGGHLDLMVAAFILRQAGAS